MARKKLQKTAIIIGAIIIFFAGIYLLRFQLFGPLLRNLVENQLSNAMGTGIEFEVSEIRGSLISDVTIKGFTTKTPGADGPLSRVEFATLQADYNLFRLLTGPALEILIGLETSGANLEVDMDWILANRQPLGVVITSLYDLIPSDLPIAADGIIHFVLGQESLDLEYDISGSLAKGVTLQVKNPNGPILPLSDRNSITLRLSLISNVLFLETVREETASDVYLNGVVTAEKPPDKPPHLIATDLVVQFAGFSLDAYADFTEIRVFGGINREERLREVITGLFGEDVPFNTGSLTFDIQADPIEELPHQFFDDLLASPFEMVQLLDVQGYLAADNWKIMDTLFNDIRSTVSWKENILDIREVNARLVPPSGEGKPSHIRLSDFTIDTKNLSFEDFPEGNISVTLNTLDFLTPFLPDEYSGYLAHIDQLKIQAETRSRNELAVKNISISGDPFSLSASGNLQVPTLDDPLTADISGEGRLDISDPGRALTIAAGLMPSLELPEGLDPGSSIQSRFSISGALNNLSGRASLEIKDPRFNDFSAETAAADFSYNDPIIELEELKIEGSLGDIRVQGRVNLEELSGNAAIAGADLDVMNLPLTGLSLSAGFAFPEITLNTLSFTAAETTWQLQSPAAVTLTDPGIKLDPAAIESAAGRVYSAGRFSEEHADLVLELNDMDISYLLRFAPVESLPDVTGDLFLDAALKGNPELPEIELFLNANNLSVAGQEGSLNISAVHDSSGIRINTLDVDIKKYLSLTGSGFLPVTAGTAGINIGDLSSSSFSLSGSTENVEALLPPGTDIPGIAEETGITVELETEGTGAEIRGVFSGLTGLPAGEISDTDLIKTVALKASVTGFDSDVLEIEGGISAPGVSLIDLAGTYDMEEGTVTGNASLNIPLERFSHMVPEPLLISGTVKGGAGISGSLTEPDITGNIQIAQGIVRFVPIIPAVSSIDGTIQADKTGITNIDIKGEMGKAPVAVSGKALFPLNPLPEVVDVRITGENALLARNLDLRVRGDVDLKFTDSGDGDYTVSGTVAVTDTLFTQDLELISFSSSGANPDQDLQLFSLGTPWAENVNFDAEITADRTIRVENNLARGDLSANLHLGGTALVPEPTGKVTTVSSIATLPLTTLQIETASLEFPLENPFTPEIMARASVRLRGYDLTAYVSGPLEDFGITISSTPTLPQDEALLLILTGLQPGGLTVTEDYQEAVITIGTALGKQLLEDAAGAISPGAKQFLERVTVQVGSNNPDEGIETIDVEYRFSNTDNWFLQFRRDEDDAYNIGLAWRLWFD
ncbi:MAG: translocation/assembly module TamB domain-containing protein [Spirochaetia bacterium]